MNRTRFEMSDLAVYGTFVNFSIVTIEMLTICRLFKILFGEWASQR